MYFSIISVNFPAHQYWNVIKHLETDIENLYGFYGIYYDHIVKEYPSLYERHKKKIKKYRRIYNQIKENHNDKLT